MQARSNEEINDSCQFVEISQFGVCLLKIFYQLMSVIKFLATGMMRKYSQEKPQKERRPDQRYTMISTNTGIQGQSTKQQEREKFRSKEMTSHIFKELTQQIKVIQKQTKGIFKQNEQSLQKIIKRHQKLQEIQSSQSEAVLAETVNLLFKRGEHINNFLNLLQSGQNQYNIKENETYAKLKETIEEENQLRIASAKLKLNLIFKQQFKEFEKRKRNEMRSLGIQVKTQTDEHLEADKLRKSHNRKTHVDQVKKLKMQIRILQEENATLKTYIKQKIEDYESIAIGLRAEKIKLENKLANIENNNGVMKSKGSIDYLKKSQTNFDQYDNIDNQSEVKSHLSLEYQGQKQNQSNTQKYTLFKKSKVALAKNTKSRVKFEGMSKNLEIISRIIQFSAPQSNYTLTQDSNVPPKKEDRSHKSLQKLQPNIRNIQKKSAQKEIESNNIKSITRAKSIERRRSSIQRAKNLQNAGVFCRNCKEKETDNNYQKEQKKVQAKKQQQLSLQFKECLIDKKEPCLMKQKRSRILKKETINEIFSEVKTKETHIQREQEEAEKIQMKNYINVEDQKQNQKQINIKKCNLKESKLSSRFESIKGLQNKSILNFPANEFIRDNKNGNMFKRNNLNQKGNIKFSHIDLIEIFITEENAKNYEILNLSLLMKQKMYFTSISKKNEMKEKKYQKILQAQDIYAQESSHQEENLKATTMEVFKVLNHYKKNEIYYKKICNFIRYPHSSIYLSQTSQWKQQQEETIMEYIQLRKLINRLIRMHLQCKETKCSHLQFFMKKIKMELQ